MKVDVHDGLDAVGAAAWNALHARTALRSPFLTWAWQSAWVRAFGEGRRLEIWRVSDAESTLVGLLPLFEAEAGQRRLTGGLDVSDYLDLIAVAGREEETWAALLQARGAGGATWDLHCVPAASATLRVVPGLTPGLGLSAEVTVEERAPVLTLPASWEAYLQGLTGKQRHELGRKMRRLEREAPEARVTSLVTAEDIGRRLDDFLTLHRQSRTGKARFMDERMEGFFRDAVQAMAVQGATRLWFLETGEGPIATFITLEWDGTVGLYNSGFRPERAAWSPGVVLLGHLIRDAIERGSARFDFLRGEERYKYEFGPTPEEVFGVRIAPARSQG